ncbi:4Fe-4S dicluster domain-containing protein [Clostridium sp. Ade.TY]|uniref:4Fe-4S dicluster domain-containing protein n=1 Tax=Clostridium sp. Ade.TY TaxID=1391647 RepID=UPI000418A6A0|nr:4Fe-4S dicluster domain-containing protein [Clostridium sp. Ade.TY]
MRFPFLKEAIKNLFRKPCTETLNNREVKNYRGKIQFDNEKCIGCGICIRVCSPKAIEKNIIKIDDTTEEISMNFDLGSCTFCGMCSDFCPKNAIILTNDFNMVTEKNEDIIVSGKFKKIVPKKFINKK